MEQIVLKVGGSTGVSGVMVWGWQMVHMAQGSLAEVNSGTQGRQDRLGTGFGHNLQRTVFWTFLLMCSSFDMSQLTPIGPSTTSRHSQGMVALMFRFREQI